MEKLIEKEYKFLEKIIGKKKINKHESNKIKFICFYYYYNAYKAFSEQLHNHNKSVTKSIHLHYLKDCKIIITLIFV